MDTRPTTHSYGTSRSFGIAGAVLFLGGFVCGWAEQPPSIRATNRDQSQVVVNPSQALIFPEQRWNLVAPNPFGATVAVWSVEPFQNVNDRQIRVDAALDLATSGRGRKSDWKIIAAYDRTDFGHGKSLAQVAAGSEGGNGQVGITVSFLGHEQPFLAEGEYEATVIGTISEGF